MESSREELEDYREKVFQELKTRAIKVKNLDTAIASNRYLLDTAGPASGLRSGNTLHVLAGASHRARLKREEARLQRQRNEAVADLKRAEERLADVDRELEALEGSEEGTEVAQGIEEGES